MNEFGSKFVDKGEATREPGDGARLSGVSPVVGSLLPVNAKTRRPAVGRQKSTRGGYALAVLVVAALAAAAFVLGRLRASSVLQPASARQHVPEQAVSQSPVTPPQPVKVEAVTPAEAVAETLAPQRRELALIPFVSIEVEPAHAEIRLDRKVAGKGSVQLAAINDGMLHQLEFVAPEHETKTIVFRNTPPAGRVILQRSPRKEAAAPKATPRTARNDAPASGPAVAALPPARARASVSDPAPDASAANNKAPRVQLIEVRMPRVEVLD
jgi:hypothetical protein